MTRCSPLSTSTSTGTTTRAHQTVAWLDESGTIPSEPGIGCVIISKKMSAAPYPGLWALFAYGPPHPALYEKVREGQQHERKGGGREACEKL